MSGSRDVGRSIYGSRTDGRELVLVTGTPPDVVARTQIPRIVVREGHNEDIALDVIAAQLVPVAVAAHPSGDLAERVVVLHLEQGRHTATRLGAELDDVAETTGLNRYLSDGVGAHLVGAFQDPATQDARNHEDSEQDYNQHPTPHAVLLVVVNPNIIIYLYNTFVNSW